MTFSTDLRIYILWKFTNPEYCCKGFLYKENLCNREKISILWAGGEPSVEVVLQRIFLFPTLPRSCSISINPIERRHSKTPVYSDWDPQHFWPQFWYCTCIVTKGQQWRLGADTRKFNLKKPKQICNALLHGLFKQNFRWQNRNQAFPLTVGPPSTNSDKHWSHQNFRKGGSLPGVTKKLTERRMLF